MNITSSTPDPEGGQIDRDANGVPTGILRESAVKLINPLMIETYESRKQCIELGLKYCLEVKRKQI
jgi:predicted amidohydrolase YtcJ